MQTTIDQPGSDERVRTESVQACATQTLEDMGLKYDWVERIQMRLAWIEYLLHQLKIGKKRWPSKDTDIQAWILRMYKIKEEASNGHHYTHEGTVAEESGSQASKDGRPFSV